MAGVNKVIVMGNLGRDPELTHTQGGMAICKFSLATSRKNKAGEEKTSWHRVTAFGKTAETIAQYVGKGQQLYIEGELSYGTYEKDGHMVYTTDIFVNEFAFVGGKKEAQPQQPQYQAPPQQQYQQPPQQYQQRPPQQYGNDGYSGRNGQQFNVTDDPGFPSGDDLPF